jgi:1-aminocyclopropane-1-carboxylate deaminase
LESYNQKIILEHSNVTLYIKREDLLHPYYSGNKFRKLKYNLVEAKRQKKGTLLTFGGAFSNHILAVAAAGFENGFKTVGVIRGEELATKISANPTLCKAQEFGMEFEFISREAYREKTSKSFVGVFGAEQDDFYVIPEGGTNDLAVQGCAEILTEEDAEFDYICCAVGTGGTISGLINCSKDGQQILGFPALKGDFLREDIRSFVTKTNWSLQTNYHFGGYGKTTPELIAFINSFFLNYDVPLDPVYTGKMVYGVLDLIAKNVIPEHAKVLMIHTGGLQGIAGMNLKLRNQKQIEIIVHD